MSRRDPFWWEDWKHFLAELLIWVGFILVAMICFAAGVDWALAVLGA